MKIILVAGGSGGHIYPCLEMAKYFIEKDCEVLLCGVKGSLEEKIYKKNNLNFKGLDINKNKISSFFKNYKKIKKIYQEFSPDALLLFGNYISVSFALVAILNHLPLYLHEQNVIYGEANKLLGFKAKRIYLSLPLNKDIHHKKSLLLGNPKSDMINDDIKLSGKYNVVIVMGSLGSSSINKLLKEFINICNSEVNYHLVIGNKYYDAFIKNAKIKENVKLYPYLNNLSSYMKAADIFVSRAGATTISEILANGACSILIPSPYVKNNHQYLNAQYLEKNNACILLKEQGLTGIKLNEEINRLLDNYSLRLKLKMNSRKLAINDSKRKIYEDMIKEYER